MSLAESEIPGYTVVSVYLETTSFAKINNFCPRKQGVIDCGDLHLAAVELL